MAEEERSLFPAIRQLEQQDDSVDCNFGAIAKQIRPVIFKHKDIGEALNLVRKASGDFKRPENTCPEFHQMYGLLRQVESDIRRHVHKEEFIQFPRAMEFAKRFK